MPILIELLEDKLNDASVSAWEESITTEEHPTYSKMVEFLQKRARVFETISINRPQHVNPKSVNHPSAPKKSNQPRFSTYAATEIAANSFNGLDSKGRMKVVTDKKLCSNCFRSDHFARNYRSMYSCKHCSKRHHSMLHPGPYELNLPTTDENAVSGPAE
ncbi:uncharacterized protein LOC135710762 [Ochlerotatus camptorhynchus]|uniref:uncharacterized protein LOC135710762 n=1 Tax=Ochlerotatus camptorhynchus TaxID=644619 RepID=UPI0031DE627B